MFPLVRYAFFVLLLFWIFWFFFSNIFINFAIIFHVSNRKISIFLPSNLISDTKYGIQQTINFSKIKREKRGRNKEQVYVNGFRFVIASQSDSTIYLKCANFRNKCKARASKRKDTGETFVTKSQHSLSCVCLIDDGMMIDTTNETIWKHQTHVFF